MNATIWPKFRRTRDLRQAFKSIGTCAIEVDTEAHLVEIPLSLGVQLNRFNFEAYANDVAFGLMGVSILK